VIALQEKLAVLDANADKEACTRNGMRLPQACISAGLSHDAPGAGCGETAEHHFSRNGLDQPARCGALVRGIASQLQDTF
jgi:hypothetical protein